MSAALPPWAQEIADRYQGHGTSQFILAGNVEDRFLLPGLEPALGGLKEFLLRALLPRFDVILTYDLGNGVRAERGAELFTQWPAAQSAATWPRAPHAATEWLTRYFRFAANLRRLQNENRQIACLVWNAHLLAPAATGAPSYELGAIASLLREWAVDDSFSEIPLATFLITANRHDLHPLVTANPRSAQIDIPFPSDADLVRTFDLLQSQHPDTLPTNAETRARLARRLRGTTLHAVESLVRTKAHRHEPLADQDVAALRKDLVESECHGLIEFLAPTRTLDDLHGMDAVKTRFREDLALWQQDDLAALPMGFLICGPVGTGKTYLVECLAGQAGVPVVKIGNFRDRWVGSTESNLEKIFRLLHALGRCFVFIDEADQTLGRRDQQANDSGLSGRIYAMIAKEMSNPDNRGRLIWVLATSRPDLVEIDLKRPGRIDVRIPLFPTATPAEGAALLRALAKKRQLTLPADDAPWTDRIPDLLTPGAAEAIVVNAYRLARTRNLTPADALDLTLQNYPPPVPLEILERQIALAVAETSDRTFLPPRFAQ